MIASCRQIDKFIWTFIDMRNWFYIPFHILQKYYERSYGSPLNTKLACPLVSDMFLTMDAAINDKWNYTQSGVRDYSGNIISDSG